MDFSALVRAAQALAGNTAHLTGAAFGPALGNAGELTHTLFDKAFPGKLVSGQDDPEVTGINQSFNKDQYGQPIIPSQPSAQDLSVIAQNNQKMNQDFGYADKQASLAGLASATPSLPNSAQALVPQTNATWRSKFQSLYDQALAKYSLDPSIEELLVTSENGKEDPSFQNTNYDPSGSPLSVDTGLLQVNTPMNDPRINQLKDPSYNIDQGLALYKQRLNNLGDPLLALASYNLGPTGAVTDPMAALQRAKHLYQNAHLNLPETDFAKDPQGYISKNQARLKGLGILP